MRACPICGGSVDERSTFCGRCGSQLLRCVRCGALNDRYFNFCHSCSQALRVGPTIPIRPPIIPESRVSPKSKIPPESESKVQIDELVYDYLGSHGGTMNWEIASKEIGIADNIVFIVKFQILGGRPINYDIKINRKKYYEILPD